jgi:hypothetical protein
MVTPERLADLADKLGRNEIVSPNDMRALIGLKPSKDKGSDELRNRNLNQADPNTEKKLNITNEFNKVNSNKGEVIQNGRKS